MKAIIGFAVVMGGIILISVIFSVAMDLMSPKAKCKRSGHKWIGPACNRKCSVCGAVDSSASHKWEKTSIIPTPEVCQVEKCRNCSALKYTQHEWKAEFDGKPCISQCTICRKLKENHVYGTDNICKVCGKKRTVVDERTGIIR